MTHDPRAALAKRYFLDDLPGAIQLGARLNGILLKVDAGEQLTQWSRPFLASNGFHALDALVGGQSNWETFQRAAEEEQAERLEKASVKAAEKVAELAELAVTRAATAKATFAAMANDPVLRRKQEAKKLRHRFDVGYIENEHYGRVMALLKRIDNGQRLKEADVLWLRTEADCWTDELHKAWHALEAAALTKAWENGGDAWNAVNASAHWRKADEPERALGVTEAALAKVGRVPKLRSALLTTRGGALRDLRRLDEAKSLGCEAHELTPKDYRPCTLLGAVHFELGDLVTGHEWYAKAESLGAPPKAIDQDLCMLLARSPDQEQQRIREFLLHKDPDRFNWLNRWNGSQRPRDPRRP
ncbi:hypothetical protein G432_10920 [Sphingomonas sp. MM-1]|nr:hypothetical protein G432_10920 [Sphingomonas sp. MM-1]